MSLIALQPATAHQRMADFGMVGAVARVFSTIGGGVVLGAGLGVAAAVAIGIFAAGVFVATEAALRR